MPIPPERQLSTPHPLHSFLENNTDIIHPSRNIHDKLYTFIHQYPEPLNIPIIQQHFPYLPESLINETFRYFEPLIEYTTPLPPKIIPPLPIHNNPSLQNATQIVSWNVGSLNTALPGLHEFITKSTTKIAIIALQETKLSATKSIKYLKNLFPEYKIISNNSHTPTTCMNRRNLPYTPTRGSLMTLIHTSYSFPQNVTKIPTRMRLVRELGAGSGKRG
jgi:hypothetical protein